MGESRTKVLLCTRASHTGRFQQWRSFAFQRDEKKEGIEIAVDSVLANQNQHPILPRRIASLSHSRQSGRAGQDKGDQKKAGGPCKTRQRWAGGPPPRVVPLPRAIKGTTHTHTSKLVRVLASLDLETLRFSPQGPLAWLSRFNASKSNCGKQKSSYHKLGRNSRPCTTNDVDLRQNQNPQPDGLSSP